MKIAIVANTAWYVWNFRRNLMATLRQAGYEPVAMADDDGYGARFQDAGFAFRSVPFTGSGLNPWREVRTALALRRAFDAEAVDVVLSYTPKGNIYAAGALAGRPATMIANISGLGRAFVSRSWLSIVAAVMYRIALRRAMRVFFQNPDDLALFLRLGLVHASRTQLLPGSGVDLDRFTPNPRPPERGTSEVGSSNVRFLMVARLIWEKGVAEYVAAARIVRRRYADSTFALLGPLDASSRHGVPAQVLDVWAREGVIEFLPATDDVRPQLAAADCVVLPSYYPEGTPRSLLEAAAMSRPIITTDTPGCRDCVVPGVSGFLCRPRDADDLARQMLAFVATPPAERETMGRAGRAMVEARFDERLVIQRYLETISLLASERAAASRA